VPRLDDGESGAVHACARPWLQDSHDKENCKSVKARQTTQSTTERASAPTPQRESAAVDTVYCARCDGIGIWNWKFLHPSDPSIEIETLRFEISVPIIKPFIFSRSDFKKSILVSNPSSTMIITLQTVPVDLLLNVGTYLESPPHTHSYNIHEITLAATLKDFEMLEYYMEKYKDSPYQISELVALSGNLKALKWVIKKGCPMDKDTCSAAARFGKLNMLKWLHKQGCPWSEDTSSVVARRGNLEMLKWLHSAGCPWDEKTCSTAAWIGNLEMLKWLHSVGCPWDADTRFWATRFGHLEMLRWLHSVGFPLNADTCEVAARYGHLEMLKWLRSADCPWNERTCSGAASSGNLEILQWLRSAGCSWNKDTCKAAAYRGNLEILQWAIGHGCPEPINDRDYELRKNRLWRM
jgi:hypothetical protein